MIFIQGEPADAVFYLQQGRVRLSVVSHEGKAAVLALSGPGEFLGETVFNDGPVLRMATAMAHTDCLVVRIEMAEMGRLLHDERGFSRLFVDFLLSRNHQLQQSLVDHLFNQCEQRLARTLIMLAGPEGTSSEAIVQKITHEILAAMVGTTRPRITFFMTRFKKLGLIEYRDGELYIKRSLLDHATRVRPENADLPLM